MSHRFKFIIISFLVWSATVSAQSIQDSTEQIVPDSLKTPLVPNLIRSAILPGWGQIEQNQLESAVVYYGLFAKFTYDFIYNFHWYSKSGNDKYKLRGYKYLFLAGQVYLFNLADVYSNHTAGRARRWDGGLFSDIPLKSPWGAVTRSAMLPGWGQLYNENYLKAAVAAALFAGFAYKVNFYQQRFLETKSSSALDQRKTNSWYLGLVYAMTMVDAYVDAYLYRFDDSM